MLNRLKQPIKNKSEEELFWIRWLIKNIVNGDSNGVVQLIPLIEIGLPSIKDFNGRSLLHLAAALGRTEICKILIVIARIDPNSIDNQGNTALHLAIATYKVEAFEALLDMGANPNIQNIDGESPMHFAAYSNNEMDGNATFLLKLLQRGGNMGAKNNCGEDCCSILDTKSVGKLPVIDDNLCALFETSFNISEKKEPLLDTLSELREEEIDIRCSSLGLDRPSKKRADFNVYGFDMYEKSAPEDFEVFVESFLSNVVSWKMGSVGKKPEKIKKSGLQKCGFQSSKTVFWQEPPVCHEEEKEEAYEAPNKKRIRESDDSFCEFSNYELHTDPLLYPFPEREILIIGENEMDARTEASSIIS